MAEPQPQGNATLISEKRADDIALRVFETFGSICAPNEEIANRTGARYWATHLVGQGATGVVIKACRTGTNEVYALKAVVLEGLSPADRVRAMAEVHLLLSCDFFSIIRCHEDHIQNGPNGEPQVLLLVLDYANAGDLRLEIRSRAKASRPFKEHEAGLLFIQVLMAVHHVHSRNMIHRDIKSANIFLCSSGIIKLGDFGFSKMYNESVSGDVGRTFCGTPYYVAPEIWKRSPYSKKADMFSLGVLLYELLTLKRPFDGTSIQEVMDRVLLGQYTPLPDHITPEMKSIVTALLSNDPSERPSTKTLLTWPICKLFIDGLIGIIHTQSVFDTAMRTLVRADIQRTRDSLTARNNNWRMPNMDQEVTEVPGGALSTTQIISNFQSLKQDHILCEGTTRKLSSDGTWKRRYVCIHCRDPLAEATSESKFDMLLAVTRSTISQQCISTPFSELEDVFPVPPKYSGAPDGYVFAIAFKSGCKRVTLQVSSAEDRQIWMRKFQQALMIDTEY